MLDTARRTEADAPANEQIGRAPSSTNHDDSLSRVATFVLAGGRGERLGVLSEGRAKPALPFGTRGRLIDFTLDNCARAALPYALVLGQYQWRSVQQAVASSAAVRESGLRAHVRVSHSARGAGGASFRGTADAVYQNLDVVGAQTTATLVLASDHIYSMEYADLIATHRRTGADITLAVAPVAQRDAHRFGVVHLDGDGRVAGFEEKPEAVAGSVAPGDPLASMGVYVFRPDFLRHLLAADAITPRSRHDFGHDILPGALRDGASIAAHRFDGYWRDVGTVDAYWGASMDLVANAPTEDRAYFLSDVEIERSVVSPDAHIESGAIVRDSIVLAGARVGANAVLERTIVDEDAHVGTGVVVERNAGTHPAETPRRLPPTVIGRGAVIPPGIRIGGGATISPEVSDELRGIETLAAGTIVRRTPSRHSLASSRRRHSLEIPARALTKLSATEGG